ncbi:hypothetical protein [Nitrospirillum iridis]|uniref:Uncharacterized protein n=1 Tax=Nitrospirillum iridis TaxID=765888 RepID=A0A7X0B0L6_9PROT|nr:hypothetical protein [Nitrospirillum iridis]MBB6252156.1 hypothetical protein [Nitrospirillum iridis]
MSLPGNTVSTVSRDRRRWSRLALNGLVAGLALMSLAGCVADGYGYYGAAAYPVAPVYDYTYPYYGYGYGYGYYGYPYIGVGAYYPYYYGGGWGHGGYWHGHGGGWGGHGGWGGGHWVGHVGGPIHH